MVRFKSVSVLKEVYKEAALTSELPDYVPNTKMVQLILENKPPWYCWLGQNRTAKISISVCLLFSSFKDAAL